MSGKVCSHPGKPLELHLISTLKYARDIADIFSFKLSAAQEKALLLHDIGKAHPHFQVRLCRNCPHKQNCSMGQQRKAQRAMKLGHSEPSAAFVLALTRDMMAAEAVRRHHSGLEDLDDVEKYWIDELEYGTRVYKVISECCWWQGAEKVAEMAGISGDRWASVLPGEREWGDCIFELADDFVWDCRDRPEKWLDMRSFYSLLITADRWDAVVGGNISYRPLVIDKSRIGSYLSAKEDSELSRWRNQIRHRVVRAAGDIIRSPGVYTITLPTGAGKTVTGLEVAMEAAERFKASGIIYVLPFISLVEQNAEVASHLLDHVQEDHHLAYFENINGDGDKSDHYFTPAERFTSFFRYWQEPVVVTTLAKFWEVLYSPRGNDTMSFHRLSRAVVLLDEPQSIPANCWEGFGSTLRLISERLGTTFILMTATQPEIAKGPELAPGKAAFPVNRYKISWLHEKMTVEEAVSFLDSNGIREKDTLVVLNTRQSALKTYFRLIMETGIRPLFLSRWVTSRDRAVTINKLKDKEKKGEIRWLVSTQVVEAGMDFDFAVVFRDLGPMDSIVQVAGRCNRHGMRNQQGQVFVAELYDEEDPNKRSFSSYVYDRVLLNQTRNLLNEKPCFSDIDCTSVVSDYYKRVREVSNQSPIWENINKGNWGRYTGLYEEKPLPEEMLVVDVDGTLGPLLLRVLSMERDLQNADERRNIFRIISRNSISVPVKYLEEWALKMGSMVIGEESPAISRVSGGIWLLGPEGIGRIYHPSTGFIPPHLSEWYSDLI